MRQTTVQDCHRVLMNDGHEWQYYLDPQGRQEVLRVVGRRFRRYAVDVIVDETPMRVYADARAKVYAMPWQCPECYEDWLEHDTLTDMFRCRMCGHIFNQGD